MGVTDTNPGRYQLFEYQGNKNFVNVKTKKCLTVEGNEDKEGGNLIVSDICSETASYFKVSYLDTLTDNSIDHTIDSEYGFNRNKRFHVVS